MSSSPFGKKGEGRNLLTGFLAILLGALLLRWGASVYTDFLWHAGEKTTQVFWTRSLAEWGGRVGAGLATALFLWLNLLVFSRALGTIRIRRRVGDLVIQERLPAGVVRWGLAGVSMVVGGWFALVLPSGTGLAFLVAFHATATGSLDPVLGADLAFYLFQLPLLRGLLTWALVTLVLTSAIVTSGYASTGAIRPTGSRIRMDPLPARHLAFLLAGILILLGLRWLLSPYLLLSSGTSGVQGIVGFTDVEARVPAFRVLASLAFLTAAVAVWGGRKHLLLPGLASAGGLGVLAFLLLGVGPAVVQRFQVQPNELNRERMHIERAIAATRDGFGLTDLRRHPYPYRSPSGTDLQQDAEAGLSRLPVWTSFTLLETLQRVEARFQYYGFQGVGVTPYVVGDSLVPVAISVRQIQPEGIPAEARTWQNLHLRERYVAGLGAVAGPVHRQTVEGGFPTWLGAVPPEFRAGPGVPEGLRLERPQVFVGTRALPHALVRGGGEDGASFLSPSGDAGIPGVDFPAGVRAASLARRALLALSLQDANLLISGEVTPETRVLFRRDVESRIRAMAPFLHLPEAPLPVVAAGRVYWIVEGFTLARTWPLSVPHAVDRFQRANYVRNSVKITVDAVTGETSLYMVDVEDPVILAWSRVFPGLLRPLDEMPEALRGHLRYSRWNLELQSHVLLRYHQESPEVFHAQQDRWEQPVESLDGATEVPYRPEYALRTLPGATHPEWALSTVLVPAGRPNLAGFLAGRWDSSAGRGRVDLWDFSTEDQVPGPRQVEALVNQDPTISQQFALWQRGGSRVFTGHLHLVTMGSTILYMEPVYLAAEDGAIPEIRRYIVSDGRRVAMEPTLSGALRALAVSLGGGVPVPEGEPIAPGGSAAVIPPGEVGFDPARALELLESAEASLRAGDWEGFGQRLRALRSYLGGRPPS
jgi:uncharacterized membrane protein (UPF0182 family)